MTAEADIEDIKRREERNRVAKGAEERGERVASEIAEFHEALSFNAGITIEELHEHLKTPESWQKFLESQSTKEPIEIMESSKNAFKAIKRIPKTVKGHDVTEWPAEFWLHHVMTSDD